MAVSVKNPDFRAIVSFCFRNPAQKHNYKQKRL